MTWRWHVNVLNTLDAVWRARGQRRISMTWPYVFELEFIGDHSSGHQCEFHTENGLVIPRPT